MIFIKKEDTFDVKVYVAEVEDKVFASSLEKEVIEERNKALPKDATEADVTCYTVVFRQATYKDNVEISKKSITTDGETITASPSTLRYERFVLLIKSWDFKNEEGNEVPITRENIDSLHPAIAGAILVQLDASVI